MSFLTVEIILWCFVNREPSLDCFWLHSMSIASANAMIIGSNKRKKNGFLHPSNGMSKSKCNHFIIIILQCEWTIVNWHRFHAFGMCALCKSDMNASTLSVRSSILFIDSPTTQVVLDNNLRRLDMKFQTPAEHDSSITFSPVRHERGPSISLKRMPYYINIAATVDFKSFTDIENNFRNDNESDDWLREREN